VTNTSPSLAPALIPGSTSSTRGLLLLVIEGYVYYLATILLFVGSVGFLAWGVLARQPLVALIALFAGLPTLALTGAVLRCLFFRLPQPQGVRLMAHDAPGLQALVEEVRESLRSPQIHGITVGTAFNASASQAGRFALFRPRNTLSIGYPLLVVLTPEQLRAVIAHELAHVFHSHGRVAGWLYRARLSWKRLATTLIDRGAVPILVRWLLATYVPRLEMRSAALAREQEGLADRYAAGAVGSRTVADALVAVELGAHVLENEFWPAIFDSVETHAEPPQPFTQMSVELRALARDRFSAELLAEMLDSCTQSRDTHPSLRDRLSALGESPHLPEVADRTAGDVYLGHALQSIAAQLDDDWQTDRRSAWRQRHAKLRDTHCRLAELASVPTADAAFERARLLEDLGRDDEALTAYEAAVSMDSQHGRALLALGRMLLSHDDAAGVLRLERSMEVDKSLAREACSLLADHYWHRNRPVEAQRYQAQATRYETQAAIASEERATVTVLDRLVLHDMAASDLEALRAGLEREPEIVDAFLARKQLRYSDGSLLVLVLRAGGRENRDLTSRIRATHLLPSDAVVIVLDRDQRSLENRTESRARRTDLRAVPGLCLSHRRLAARELAVRPPGLVATSADRQLTPDSGRIGAGQRMVEECQRIPQRHRTVVFPQQIPEASSAHSCKERVLSRDS